MDTSTSVQNAGIYQNQEMETRKGVIKKMVNNVQRDLSLTNDVAPDDLQLILSSLRAVIKDMSEENFQMSQALKYYGYSDWKAISVMDRGKKARNLYEKVVGGCTNGR